MPREITAWACAFRCGGRINSSRAAIVRHEATCASNPARKACRTCEHQGQEGYGDPWVCDLDKVPEGRTLAVDCEWWALAERDKR